MKKILIPAIVIIVLLIGFFFASPYIALYNIRSAAVSGDAKALSSYMDFDQLRDSIKAGINKKMGNSGADTATSGNLGNELASAFADKLVDIFVTPEGISKLMALKNNKAEKESNKSDSADNEKSKDSPSKTFSYSGLNNFVIAVDNKKEKSSVKIVMKRHGLFFWKLSGVEF